MPPELRDPRIRLTAILLAVTILLGGGFLAWHLVRGGATAATAEAGPSGAASPSPTPAAADRAPAADPAATPAATPTPTASATPTPEAVHPARTATIGDSIMAGLGLDDGQAWPELIASADSAQIDDLGCSGAGFVAVGDCGDDYDGLVSKAAAGDPDLVIIQSSDNDLGESASTIQAATTRTVLALRQALPDAVIVGLSTLWDQPGAVPDEVAESSAALQSAIAQVGGLYLDIGQPIAGRDGMLQSDAEHPTLAGQQVLADTVRQALAGVGIAL